MALVVEDGTGLSNADSYVSVEEADAYHLLYGNDEWATLANKEVLLRRASRDIDLMFGTRYQSRPFLTTQSLLWPRIPYYSSPYVEVIGVSQTLKNAVMELALIEATTDVLGPDDFSGNIKSSTKKVGDLEKSVEYFGPNGTSVSNKLTKVYALMSGLFGTRSSGHYVTLVR